MRLIKYQNNADVKSLSKIKEILQGGGVIAYPTDTIYGLGCHPGADTAIERIYKIKGRESSDPLLLLIDSSKRLNEWCKEIPESAVKLIEFWPAQLTIVLPVVKGINCKLLRGGSSLGFRVPDSALCREICAAAGGAITSTSINRSGQEPLHSPVQIEQEFAREIDALVDCGPMLSSQPSTIVRCTGSDMEILREGAFIFPSR